MKPADAADEYWATVDDVEAHKPIASRYEKACDVLKEHMVERGLDTFQGIKLIISPGGRRLDQKAAIAKLGAKADDCFKDTVRRTLLPFKRPKRHQPAA